MRKHIEPITKNIADLEPSDADTVFSAKVCLLFLSITVFMFL